jgi:hypothetical protein
LGCGYPQSVVRQPAPEKETKGQRNERERESLVWEPSVRGSGPVPPTSQWIDVGDRGCDLFPFWQACQERGDDFTIPVVQDRGVAGDGADAAGAPDLLHLTSRARTLPAQERRLLHLPTSPDRPARDAVLEMRFQPVCIPPPIHNATLHPTPLPLWGVRLWEPLPPSGVEPREGMVLTSLPVLTIADAWNRCRWLIEAFPPVLKSGCRMDNRRLHTVAALPKLRALLTPIGMRVLCLQQRATRSPDGPATPGVSQEVLDVLALLDQRPGAQWTVWTLCQTMARFGGFLARTCDGLAGWQTWCNGWVFVHTVLLGVHLAALLPPS